MQAMARESIWNLRVPLSAAIALALFAFVLGYGMGGLESGADAYAAKHPDEARLARLLVWGALLTIGWACRRPIQELIQRPSPPPLLLGALAFVPIMVAELAASRFTIAFSPYELCGPNGPPALPPLIDLPRSVILGSTALFSLMAWGRHLAGHSAMEEAPIAPAHAWLPSTGEWLDLPEDPFLRVRASDVSHIRSAGNYSEIIAQGRVHLVRAPLSDLAARFAGHGFVRVHRQVVVNRCHVSQIYRETGGRPAVQLQCGALVPLGRSYRSALAAFGC
jgi:hypothetical protein